MKTKFLKILYYTLMLLILFAVIGVSFISVWYSFDSYSAMKSIGLCEIGRANIFVTLGLNILMWLFIICAYRNGKTSKIVIKAYDKLYASYNKLYSEYYKITGKRK